METAPPALSLEPVITAGLRQDADEILRRAEQTCLVADAAMLVLRDDRQRPTLDYVRTHARHLETHWTDGAIGFTSAVLDAIAGPEGAGGSCPTAQSVARFEALSVAAATAIDRASPLAAGLVRGCCLAAQELRRGGSTGRLGSVRLGAKLRVARLIGHLARREPAMACKLATLNLYTAAISAAQIAEHAATRIAWPTALESAIKPTFMAALTQACWLRSAGDADGARRTLDQARSQLQAAGRPGEPPALPDLYRAALAREAARIDGPAGYAWCADVQEPALRCSGRLLACLHGPAWTASDRADRLRELVAELKRHHLLDAPFDLGRRAIEIVAEAKVYPEFPPLPWNEVSQPEPTPQSRLPRPPADPA